MQGPCVLAAVCVGLSGVYTGVTNCYVCFNCVVIFSEASNMKQHFVVSWPLIGQSSLRGPLIGQCKPSPAFEMNHE